MLGCTNAWHGHQNTDYCTSCGERKDGKMTLANCPMGVGAMSAQLFLLRHFKTGEIRRGRMTEMSGQGMRFERSGKPFWITAEESHAWELWPLSMVRADDVPLDREFCHADQAYRRVSLCGRTIGPTRGPGPAVIYTANRHNCNISTLEVSNPVCYPLPEPWLSGDPINDAT